MTLNNYFQSPGKSTNDMQWAETLSGATWTAVVDSELTFR